MPHRLADAPLLRPREPCDRVETEPARLRRAEAAWVEHERLASPTTRSPRATSIAFAWPANAERSRPWSSSVTSRPSAAGQRQRPEPRRARATAPTAVIPLQSSSVPSAQTGSSCRHSTSGPSATARRTISSRCPSRSRRHRVAVEDVPGADEQGTRTSLRGRCASSSPIPPPSRPPTTTSWRPALARAGAEVELVTSHFRFGEAPAPDGYARSELFYPLSSRLFRRSRLRLPLKVAEHPLGLARAATAAAPTCSTSSGSRRRELDARLWRPHARRRCSPRTTCCRAGRRGGRSSGGACSAASSASSSTASTAARRSPALGVDAGAAARHPPPRLPERPGAARRRPDRPLLRRDPPLQGARRRDRGRPPRRRRAPARGRRPGSSRSSRTAPPRAGSTSSGGSATCRRRRSTGAFGEATVAVFPYRPELDQSGALLRALGAGVPAVAYDVGGRRRAGARLRGRPRRRRRATSRRSPRPSASCSRRRDGARPRPAPAPRRAREELTWDAAAAAHLDVYRELA